jgi:hypothetical protein
MASIPKPYLTVEGAIEVRRAPMRVQTPIVLEFDGRRLALTRDQAVDLQLRLAAALVRDRRAD